MSATVLEFRKTATPIAQFIRIDDAHRRFEDLYAAGHLPIRRAVFDASRIEGQRDFVEALRRDGVEIVLDTEVAELAAPEKLQTHVKKAPWATAAEGGLLDPSYFDGTHTQVNIVKWIAQFAVEQKVDTVLAPTHYLHDRTFSDWLHLDAQSCVLLRQELDLAGGRNVAIDYPILHSHTALHQQEVRDSLMERVVDLPVDNVWIRASGLGTGPKPQSTRQFLKSLYDLQHADKPIIIDYIDGLMAHSLLAFGGASGLAHGIGERQQFSAGTWHNPPKERDPDTPFGRKSYIPVPGLGRRLSTKEIQLLASAKGGRKYLSCQDACCKHGLKDMLTEARQHAANQAISPVRNLAEIPDLNREIFFLEKPLREAERLARNIKDLNPSKSEADELQVDPVSLKRRMTEHHRKIGKLYDTLNLLHDERGPGAQRATPCNYRTGLAKAAEQRVDI